MRATAVMLGLLMFSVAFSGCYGKMDDSEPAANLSIPEELNSNTAPRGQIYTMTIESNVDYTVHRANGTFFVDEFGVFRDAMNMTFDSSIEEVKLLIMDTESSSIDLIVTAGDEMWNGTIELTDSDEMMIVDGRRAYDTIDMLTSQYNNRWCASAGPGGVNHEGGAAYEAAAEAMADEMWEMGVDFVEVTRYDDDPDQLNVVGYNWGRVNPDEYIVVGGHFDIAYAFTPPSGGTNEGAIDDTSGSTVSLEMAQALAQLEFDHTVVAGLWACEEEGLLGSRAYVDHLPENVTVRAYMNFDMVALNYPITPPSEPLIGPG